MQIGTRESKADLSTPNVTWQNCYRGKETFTQVDHTLSCEQLEIKSPPCCPATPHSGE